MTRFCYGNILDKLASYLPLLTLQVRIFKLYPYSISEIEEVVFEYGYKCRPLPEFVVQPKKKKKAYMAWRFYFTAKPTIIGLIDFVEDEKTALTKVNAYWYRSNYRDISDKIVLIINNPQNCIETTSF